jgi:hypothetical protein
MLQAPAERLFGVNCGYYSKNVFFHRTWIGILFNFQSRLLSQT